MISDHPEGRKLIAPPVTPESLYLQDKRRRSRDKEELEYARWEARQRDSERSPHPTTQRHRYVTVTRYFVMTTDDVNEAYDELRRRRATGERGWDMAEVRTMTVPPKTVHIFCVFRDVQNSREKHVI